MSARSDRDSWPRRKSSTDGQQHRQVAEKHNRPGRRVRGFARDSSSLRRTVSIEENVPTALPLLLEVVGGPDRLPADEEFQEMLRGKLRILQADSTEVNALFTELSTHLISINSEEKVIFVSFKTFEEIWKFTTYYTMGFLGQCMENLLWDQKFWLSSLEEEDVAIEVSVQEDTLNLLYKGILMQEGSLFASCSTNQMFDSSTSGGDLYLEQGDIAQFEPPFLGSGWTVLCLADGARGTAPKPGLEPVVPFHQWFLKSCAESTLVGDGKPPCDFPLPFARGTCLATVEYDAEGPDELSVAPGDRIIIVGLLVSCFDWFTGRKEATGEVGLVKTSLVEPYTDINDSADIFLDGEEGTFFSLEEDKVIEETNALLKKKSQNDIGHNYKLDMITDQDAEEKTSLSSSSKVNAQQTDVKTNIQRFLDRGCDSLPSTVAANGTRADSVLAPEAKSPSPSCFTVHPVVEGDNNTEIFLSLFSFLGGRGYKIEFKTLYGLSPELLASSTFTGHSDSDELIAFLGAARETARKKRLLWSQTRLCFLLGKLCAGRSKFSQARVYFEEALSVPREGFADLRLLASIYSNLVPVYLLQKNTESFFALTERLAALLLGIPDSLECLEDNSALKYILKKAVLSHNRMAEARACHLLAKHHWTRAEGAQVVPYLERLLVLCTEAQRTWGVSPSHEYLALGRLYSQLRLPHLSVSSARRASQQPSATLTDCLSSMLLLLDNVNRLNGITEQDAAIPPQGVPYLHRALSSIKLQEGGSDRHHVLSHQLTVCLCQLFCKHRMVGHAIGHMHTLVERNPPSQRHPISVPERNGTLIWLAWLHIDYKQPDVALDILEAVLASMPEHCTSPQEGVVLNMRGITLRCMGDLRRAAESYQAAVDICQEYEDMPNWAVAQANLGLLCLKCGAKGLAQRHLTEAVQLFSELDEEGHEANFITVLLELGQHYVKQHQLDLGKGCLEWALLLAINANLLDCQLTATRHLCHLYGCESPDQTQCIIYSQHLVQLLTHTGDRGQEGDALEAISQLYLTLGTEKAYRAALDYTKTSLGISIDLGCREKEAYGWLQAGKIYHLVDQIELVDLYVQVAQDVALSTGDTGFILKLLEAAGDIFFNSSQERDKAITFYRDRALPIAVKISSVRSRLRLCNKLTELMLSLKLYEDAVEFAQTALDISVTLGERLNERVAYHRLASLYHCLDQYELAEHYYLKTLTLCPTPLLFDEETLYYVRVYQTLGDIMFYDLKDPFDAAGYYHLALAAAMDLGNKRSQLQLCTRLATIYHNFLIDRELSLFFYQKARAFAAELNVRRINISPEQQYTSTPQYKITGQ